MTLSDHDLPIQPVLQRPKRRSGYYQIHMEQLFFTGSPVAYDFFSSLGTNMYQYWRWLHRVVSIGRLVGFDDNGDDDDCVDGDDSYDDDY